MSRQFAGLALLLVAVIVGVALFYGKLEPLTARVTDALKRGTFPDQTVPFPGPKKYRYPASRADRDLEFGARAN